MPKLNFMTVVVVGLAGLVGYLVFHPTAANNITAWLQQQSGLQQADLPDTRALPAGGYVPVVPAR